MYIYVSSSQKVWELSESEVIEKAKAIIHPIRFAIIRFLLANDGAYITEITKGLGNPIDRRLVSFHLAKLEEQEFVSWKYEISENRESKGRAIKRYSLTPKVHKVVSDLCDEVDKIR